MANRSSIRSGQLLIHRALHGARPERDLRSSGIFARGSSLRAPMSVWFHGIGTVGSAGGAIRGFIILLLRSEFLLSILHYIAQLTSRQQLWPTEAEAACGNSASPAMAQAFVTRIAAALYIVLPRQARRLRLLSAQTRTGKRCAGALANPTAATIAQLVAANGEGSNAHDAPSSASFISRADSQHPLR